MKVSGNGQAKILTAIELSQLFSDGLISNRDRCLFNGCRISEALSLQKSDIISYLSLEIKIIIEKLLSTM